ncbi:reverse transcriptase domain-containing protein [Cerasibacillus sp. JNUCC 74]
MKSNRLQLHTPLSSATANWREYQTKKYLHFDTPINIKDVKHLIEDSKWIKSHAFFPFIHFEIVFNKYVLKDFSEIEETNKQELRKKKTKTRSIMYASHMDQFIFKYYGNILNNYYNEYALNNGIDESVLAYRNNKKGKNNLHFSAEVFQFILAQDKAIIISLDFSSFFDNITHRELKKNIKTILSNNEIPLDIYHVFKNTTKYSYVNKEKIDEYLIKKFGSKKALNKLKKNHRLRKIMPYSEFRRFKRKYLYKNKKPFGIPQGSGISAVFSNIHLIHFDTEMMNWAKNHNALYRRYSDDLIMIIPSKFTKNEILNFKKEIMTIVNKYKHYGLHIQEEKTEIRIYKDKQIYDENDKYSTLDYLGLVMDGKSVQLREKSLFKYYTRAYHKAKVCKEITRKTGKKFERKKLYKIYTHLGFKYKGHGNFISYAKKADKIMKSIGLKSRIHIQVKRHWNKIQRKLNNSQ